jgi:hypothetical protein
MMKDFLDDPIMASLSSQGQDAFTLGEAPAVKIYPALQQVLFFLKSTT